VHTSKSRSSQHFITVVHAVHIHHKPHHNIVKMCSSSRVNNATEVTVAWSVRMSVTLLHPAKVVGRNEMPFVRDTVYSYGPKKHCIRQRPRSLTQRGDLGQDCQIGRKSAIWATFGYLKFGFGALKLLRLLFESLATTSGDLRPISTTAALRCAAIVRDSPR